MSKPTQGKQYTIKSGDTLSSIASQAYGDPTQTAIIEGANQSQFKSTTGELITGTTITIPNLPEDQSIKDEFSRQTVQNDPEKMIFILAGREITPSSGRILRMMDSAADGWTAVLPLVKGEDPDLDARVGIYAYTKAQAFIGNQRLINGRLYGTQPGLDNDAQVVNLEGWSNTVDMVDSTLKPPYEVNNVTLEQRAEELLKPIGIKAIFEADTGGPFEKITATKTDKIFTHLAKLATQRGVLLSSTVDGDAAFIRSATGAPVASLEEGQTFALNYQAKFDGRKRYASYKAVASTPKKKRGKATTGTANDNLVPLTRFLTFTANDTTEGNIQIAADWRRSKQVAESLSIPIIVSSWYDPKGNLWRENTLVSVTSPTLGIPDGYIFLIRSVEYLFEADGISATLNVVPPQVYTGEPLEIPWGPFEG